MHTAMSFAPSVPNTASKACPTSALPAAPAAMRPVSRSTKPEVSTTSAVRVHTTMVSANTSKMPHIPCCTGSFTLEAACTITEEPSPASLEKAPRLKPHVTARDRP